MNRLPNLQRTPTGSPRSLSPSSRKRRVLKVEMCTGTLSPGLFRRGGSSDHLPLHQAHVSRPPLTASLSNNSRMPRKQGRSQPRAQSPVDMYHKKESRSVMDVLLPLTPTLELLFLLVLLVVVVESYMHMSSAQSQLLQFREQGSSLLLQLHKIERHSMQVHRGIQRRLEAAGVDVEQPLSVHTSELSDMSSQLHTQVRSVRKDIQEDALQNLIEEHGEGPVKLVLDLDFSEPGKAGSKNLGSTSLTLLLWQDTPHAEWTLLEQVGRNVWDGAQFRWGKKQPILEITPSAADPLDRGHLKFSEPLPDNAAPHDAWTVGLREDPATGRLQLFLNLQDNAEFHAHETCIGRITDGFDALQRILEVTRSSEDGAMVTVRQTSSAHVDIRDLGFN